MEKEITTTDEILLENLDSLLDDQFTKPEEESKFFSLPKNDSIKNPGEENAEEDALSEEEKLAKQSKQKAAEEEENKIKQTKSSNYNPLVNITKKLIEKKLLYEFDDNKKPEEYTEEDFLELYEANFNEIKKEAEEIAREEFINSLPNELRYAAEYVFQGGTDLKSLFKALSHVEEVRELNIENERDQEQIVREYLLGTNFGNEQEVEEEIEALKDRGELKTKAARFKPKLEAAREQMIQAAIARQEKIKQERIAQAQQYQQMVANALKDGEIGGIKVDKKTLGLLYHGLVNPTEQSIRGNKTTYFASLLEKYQFIEPNPKLMAEVLWLMHDPEEYKREIRKQGEKAAKENTLKKLKFENDKGLSRGDDIDEYGSSSRDRIKKLNRPSFFSK